MATCSPSQMAFDKSDIVGFEFDALDPGISLRISACTRYNDGRTLQDVIPADLYERIENHLEFVESAYPGWVNPEVLEVASEYCLLVF